jgi:hypothetical protein
MGIRKKNTGEELKSSFKISPGVTGQEVRYSYFIINNSSVKFFRLNDFRRL